MRTAMLAIGLGAALLGPSMTTTSLARPVPTPHLFSSYRVVEAAWSHDTRWVGHGGYCTTGGHHIALKHGDDCSYLAHGIEVGVTYGAHGEVWDIGLPAYDPQDGLGNKNPTSKRYWTFLVSLVPPGARKLKCGRVARSDQGGPAWACVYRLSHPYASLTGKPRRQVVVAQYLAPSAGGDNGHVITDDFNMGLEAVVQ